MTHPALIERITRSLAYMLRHQPEKFDLDLDAHGFGDLAEVVRALNERLGEPVEVEDVEVAIASGDRPRYEIQGEKVRALYGHSIDVEPGETARPPELLYVGINARDARRAVQYGLRGGRRRFLHLAKTPEEARETGKRTGREYAVLTVFALDAWEEGVNFYDRQALFLAEQIPTDFLEITDTYEDGIEPAGDRDRGRGRSDRPERHERHERSDRRGRRGDRGPRRDDRGPRRGRGDRPDRGERSERPERPERSERPERHERSERPERPERPERSERPEETERRERPERSERPASRERSPERRDRPRRDEDRERPARREERTPSAPRSNSSTGGEPAFGEGLVDEAPVTRAPRREAPPPAPRTPAPTPAPAAKPETEPAKPAPQKANEDSRPAFGAGI